MRLEPKIRTPLDEDGKKRRVDLGPAYQLAVRGATIRRCIANFAKFVNVTSGVVVLALVGWLASEDIGNWSGTKQVMSVIAGIAFISGIESALMRAFAPDVQAEKCLAAAEITQLLKGEYDRHLDLIDRDVLNQWVREEVIKLDRLLRDSTVINLVKEWKREATPLPSTEGASV